MTDVAAQAFVVRLQRRAHRIADDLYDPEAYEIAPPAPEELAGALIRYLLRRAWAEWYFGVTTPARQLLLVPAGAFALRMRLARQIADEIAHHDRFLEAAVSAGGPGTLDGFVAPPDLVAMYEVQLASATAGELGAANQLGGEIVLLAQARRERSVLRRVLPAWVMAVIERIEQDEPAHVAAGRALVVAAAGSLEHRRGMWSAQARFLAALIRQHLAELATLGARRVRAAPTLEIESPPIEARP